MQFTLGHSWHLLFQEEDDVTNVAASVSQNKTKKWLQRPLSGLIARHKLEVQGLNFKLNKYVSKWDAELTAEN